MKCQLRTLLLCLLTTLAWAAEVVEKDGRAQVTYLDAGTIIDYQPVSRHRGFFETDLRTYCYRGAPMSMRRFFETVELQLDIDGDDYTQYEGATPTKVREHYDERRSLFSFNIFAQKRQRVQLSPFTQQCIGIETVQPYRVRLYQLRVDFWRVIQLLLGVTLFVYAGHLSNNSVFYYLTGVTLGICSSFMLVIWLSSKLMPRRPMVYGMLIGGWTLGVYIIQRLWDNLQLIFQTYRIYVFWYILITGLVSFFFCYRLGPPKNRRSKNIIKWLMQVVALLLIYLSSHYEEASIVVAVITVVVHYFPRSILQKTRGIVRRFFPPKRRLLTNEEYEEQGVRETTRALEELRAYASSPECKQWKMMSKLRDPLRFAAFVEGDSHLRDEEILQFESSRLDENDMSDSDMSVEEEDMVEEQQSEEGAYVQRSQRQHLQHRNITFEEMSDDDNTAVIADDDDDDVVEVPAAVASTSAYSLRHTPNLSSSRHLYSSTSATGSLRTLTQRNSPLRQQDYEAPRQVTPRTTLNRSSRLVTSAQRNSSGSSIRTGQQRQGSAHRNLGVREYSGDSDGY